MKSRKIISGQTEEPGNPLGGVSIWREQQTQLEVWTVDYVQSTD